MINKSDIEKYIEEFYGYGNWNSRIWFIGIEEGGGNSEIEVKKRINSWKGHMTDLIDNKVHHIRIGIPDLFIKGTLQSTWRKLIRLKLSYENQIIDNNTIREIQKSNWGQSDSDNALIELFPLPSPNNNKWKYSSWSSLDYLKNRNSYYEHISSFRVNYIRSKIEEFKPKIVILYAASMLNYWSKLVETDFKGKSKSIRINKNYLRILKIRDTYFVQTPQPSAVYNNEFWTQSGFEIRKYCNEK